MLTGLEASFTEPENGMTRADMEACERTADRLNEVIVFRSTGPWAKRWLEAVPPFPSKNFHVKGKSSNWGPQAGFVPYNGIYSKVGYDAGKAAEGTKKNEESLHHGKKFAVKSVLNLTAGQIQRQLTEPAENRLAIYARIDLSPDQMLLHAHRYHDRVQFTFLAQRTEGVNYDIYVFLENGFHTTAGGAKEPLYIMGSNEMGANGKAMTGDYDLLAVCPPIHDRFSQVGSGVGGLDIFSKADIHLKDGSNKKTGFDVAKGLTYRHGMGMDNVLDGRLHTGSDNRAAHDKYNAKMGKPAYTEHGDLGNVTPRILRCINMLNDEMKATGAAGWQRRVHHNAESHRYIAFGALQRAEMEDEKKREGFPFTCFLPKRLAATQHAARYGTVCTLMNMGEFTAFCEALDTAEYWVPTNFTWKMKNKVTDKIAMWNARAAAPTNPPLRR